MPLRTVTVPSRLLAWFCRCDASFKDALRYGSFFAALGRRRAKAWIALINQGYLRVHAVIPLPLTVKPPKTWHRGGCWSSVVMFALCGAIGGLCWSSWSVSFFKPSIAQASKCKRDGSSRPGGDGKGELSSELCENDSEGELCRKFSNANSWLCAEMAKSKLMKHFQ